MASITKPFAWFYNEFGLVSVSETGRNAWLIILVRKLPDRCAFKSASPG